MDDKQSTKTITVTESVYDALVEMQKLLKTQDEASTKYPLFTIRRKERVILLDGDETTYSDGHFYMCEETEYENLHDLYICLIQEADEDDSILKMPFNDFEKHFISNELDQTLPIIQKFFYKNIEVTDGELISLFEGDVRGHIGSARRVYVESSYRMPLMSKLIDILQELKL